jgi:DUF2934 family protein
MAALEKKKSKKTAVPSVPEEQSNQAGASAAEEASAAEPETASVTEPEPAAAAAPEPQPGAIDPELRRRMIETAAYFRAERRGFHGGSEMTDWVEAEAEVDRLLQGGADTGQKLGDKMAFLKDLEGQLVEWDAKLDQLKAKAKKARADMRSEYDKQLQALGEKRAGIQEKLQELGKRTELAWEDLKVGLEKAGDEMRHALDSVTKRFK